MSAHLEPTDLDLFALGALEGEERRAATVHLKSCPGCRQSLEHARGRLAMVMMTSPSRPVPPDARRSLLERVERESLRPRRRKRAWVVPLLAAAVLLLAVALGVALEVNRRLRGQVDTLRASLGATRKSAARAERVAGLFTSPHTLKVDLVATGRVALPQGRLLFNSRRGLFFYAANLPPVPSSKTYQLWLVPLSGKPVSYGILRPDQSGSAELVSFAAFEGGVPAAFALTVEPAGGVPQPTGPKVLVGVVR